MKKIISVISIIIIGLLNINIVHANDLITDYRNATQNSADYRFGANLSFPYNGNNQIASVGLNANMNKGCGAFGALTSLTASFNAQAMENLGVALLSSTPTLLLCYASQTMCDAYKFARNLAQAMAHLSTMNCQQIEKLAINTGDALRKEGVNNCINTKFNASSGTSADFQKAMADCEANPSTNQISTFLNDGANMTGSYTLSQWINKQYPSSQYPLLNTALSTITGDITWSGGGMQRTTPLLGLETMQSQSSQLCYNAIKNTIENAVSNGTAPASGDLAAVSLPGQPITPYFASKLMALPSDMRNSFYSQYSTVYGTVTTLYALQQLEDSLEASLSQAPGPGQKEPIRDEINKLKTRMNYLTQQLDMQKNYLNPMVGTVMEYKLPNAAPAPTQQDIQPDVPVGLSR